MTDWPWAFMWSVVALAVAAVVISREWQQECPTRDTGRACALAAGNARATLPWLTEGHPRREAGLLLLSRDAAWAPVCARDHAAGARLQNEIDAAIANLDAPGAGVLALRLVMILEDR